MLRHEKIIKTVSECLRPVIFMKTGIFMKNYCDVKS